MYSQKYSEKLTFFIFSCFPLLWHRSLLVCSAKYHHHFPRAKLQSPRDTAVHSPNNVFPLFFLVFAHALISLQDRMVVRFLEEVEISVLFVEITEKKAASIREFASTDCRNDFRCCVLLLELGGGVEQIMFSSSAQNPVSTKKKEIGTRVDDGSVLIKYLTFSAALAIATASSSAIFAAKELTQQASIHEKEQNESHPCHLFKSGSASNRRSALHSRVKFFCRNVSMKYIYSNIRSQFISTISLWPSFAIVQLNVFKIISFDSIRYFSLLSLITGLLPSPDDTILSPFCHNLALCHHLVTILSQLTMRRRKLNSDDKLNRAIGEYYSWPDAWDLFSRETLFF